MSDCKSSHSDSYFHFTHKSLLHRVRHPQGKGTMVRLKFDRPYRLILIQDDQSNHGSFGQDVCTQLGKSQR
jgi:hypothetical protein